MLLANNTHTHTHPLHYMTQHTGGSEFGATALPVLREGAQRNSVETIWVWGGTMGESDRVLMLLGA